MKPTGGRVGATVERFEVTLEGLSQLRQRIDHQQLEPADWPLVGALVSQLIGRTQGRQQRMIAKIEAAAAAAQDSPSREAQEGGPAGASSSSGASATGGGPLATPPPAGAEPAGSGKPKAPGHGRNGASAYRNAEHFVHTLAPGVLGAVCAACRLGKIWSYRAKIGIRIRGRSLFGAEAHHFEQGRCRNCGHIVRAEGPPSVHEGIGTDYVRYDASACAMLLVMHYFAGAPFKRLESLYRGWGVPMPDANQWDIVNASDDLLLPLYEALEQHAIHKATHFRIDDTGSMVLSLQKADRRRDRSAQAPRPVDLGVRTGINATGTYWETPDGPILLFYIGRHHAGEIVDRLLRHRLPGSPKLVKCTDGASKNFDHSHAGQLVESTCNAHALLKFRDIKDKVPAEYAEAGSLYTQVFDNDDKAEALGLTPVDRMLYHRERSKPLMQELKNKCIEKLTSRRVEPSSALWEPLTFIVNQWERLTQFCEMPGVPLDTNLVEQALIVPVRYLAGSFNYHTEEGAVVGDHGMSLIATARAQELEPVAYLTDCLRSSDDLAKRPEYYLPWVYRDRIKQGASPGDSPPARTRQRRPTPRSPPQPTTSA